MITDEHEIAPWGVPGVIIVNTKTFWTNEENDDHGNSSSNKEDCKEKQIVLEIDEGNEDKIPDDPLNTENEEENWILRGDCSVVENTKLILKRRYNDNKNIPKSNKKAKITRKSKNNKVNFVSKGIQCKLDNANTVNKSVSTEDCDFDLEFNLWFDSDYLPAITDKENYRINENGEYVCEECGKIAKNKKYMKLHQKKHLQNASLCYKCGLNCKTAHFLSVHESKCFQDENNEELRKISQRNILTSSALRSKQNLNVETENPLCNVNIEIEVDERNLHFVNGDDNSVDIINENTNDNGDEKFNSNCSYNKNTILKSLDDYKAIDPEGYKCGKNWSSWKERICSYCGKISASMLKHKDHLNKHTGQKPYNCVCGKNFSVSTTYFGHLKTCSRHSEHLKKIALKNKINESNTRNDDEVNENELNCKECDTKFETKRSLINHKRYFHNFTNFTCKLCGKLYVNKPALRVHIINNHMDKIRCKICNKLFGHKSYRAHIKRHQSIKNHKCSKCDEKFLYKYELQRHKLKIHKDTEIGFSNTLYNCSLCKMNFNEKKDFLNHLNKEDHQINENDWKKVNSIDYFNCNKCEADHNYFIGYAEHMLKHGNHIFSRMKEALRSIIVAKENEKNKITKDNEENNQQATVNNLNTSDNDTTDIEKIRKPKEKNEHRIDKERGGIKECYENGLLVTRYFCKICHKNYLRRGSLWSHLKYEHTDKSQCDVCGKKMNQSFINIHMRTHTGERPFVCTEYKCNKSFIAKSHLNGHIKNVHNNRRKIYVCVFCNNCSFVTFKGIQSHLLKLEHIEAENIWKSKQNIEQYECKRCPNKFDRFGDFARHSSHHHNEHLLTKMKTYLTLLTNSTFEKSNEQINKNDKNNASTSNGMRKGRKRGNFNYEFDSGYEVLDKKIKWSEEELESKMKKYNDAIKEISTIDNNDTVKYALETGNSIDKKLDNICVEHIVYDSDGNYYECETIKEEVNTEYSQ